jgi:hypothetical protein
MRFVGQSLSLAIMGAVAATVIPPEFLATIFAGIGNGSSIPANVLLRGESQAFIVGAVIAAFGVATSLVRGRGKEASVSSNPR